MAESLSYMSARIARYRYFEFWPMGLFYFPVVIYYLWLSIRYRCISLPVWANPGIENGGVVGESKVAILDFISKDEPSLLKYQLFLGLDLSERIQLWMQEQRLDFPIIVKPDVGQRGSGVSLVQSRAELDRYVSHAGFAIIVQEYCNDREEVGVNYRRRPGEATGEITGITRKRFPSVVGDGRKTLRQLILCDSRARYMAKVYFSRHARALDQILSPGQRLRLVESGNHCQGAIFEDGRELIAPGLTQKLDKLAQAIPEFFMGRFDLRFKSEDDLRSGRNFKIIEINGGAGEATHIYDARRTLLEAYSILFAQLRDLFEIGRLNRQRTKKNDAHVIQSFLRFRKESKGHPPTS